MNIHEYQAKQLLEKYGVPVPKGGVARTPEEADMELLAIPFTPTHAEYIYLQGKRVLADQMEFLRAHFPRTSPLHDRMSAASTSCSVSSNTIRNGM